MEPPPQLTRMQFRAAWSISVIALLIVVARHIWPTRIFLDQGVLGLLALAVLPWLTLFFKKFKVPGIGEAETQEREQGTTEKPLPPANDAPRIAAGLQILEDPNQVPRPAAALSPDTRKVLATLWRYQRQSFGDDTTKRWTFRIDPYAREFPRYLNGLAQAVNEGWVSVSRENQQCMLTNEGLAYVAGNPEIQQFGDVYLF